MYSIDHKFIERAEARRLRAYVPQRRDGTVIGRSGVTMATGVDVGHMSREQVIALAIGDDLKRKLLKYVGLTGQAAVTALIREPLMLSEREASLLDKAVHSRIIRDLAARFERASGQAFDAIPPEAQTVLASLAINFGPAGLESMRKTWAHIKALDWPGLSAWLDKFPSKQKELQSRRRTEAALLRDIKAAT